MACSGLSSISGLRVVPTGWVHLDGVHVVRRELKRLLTAHGATMHPEFSLLTDLVILGDYRSHQTQNDRVGGTDALEQVYLSRQERAPHVHLVSEQDLADLLAGEHVPCRRIPPTWVSVKRVGRRTTVRVRPRMDP